MPLRLVFHASLPKEGYASDENEDFFLIDAKFPTTRFALSDGATESYDSRGFSRLLCDQWVKRRLPVIPLRTAQRAYDARLRDRQLSWADAAAIERGSFATLLAGVVEDTTLRIIAIGDSLLVHVPLADGGTGMQPFPYSEVVDFEQAPLLLSTRREKSSAFGLQRFRMPQHTRKIPLQTGEKLLCMTDAVGAWFLAATQEQQQRLIDEICTEDNGQFAEFVNDERKRGTLRNDDSTLLIFDVADINTESSK
ncbi:hypothetical protein Ga0100231_017565 [Opitutaceae bacterium TAV4]|nr:hypothetical protein Ga0100231_017565 [Opitutaceae bacterium TAV4]RRJ99194.1 hypothetical protein Ga0100230_013290 [Opitutaceae bacterium TAV3]